MEKTKTLNLRYNEMMCNDWNGLHECPGEPKKYDHGQLVLSWKRLNVSVEKITHKFFVSSKTTRQQILYNVSGNVQCGNLLGIMGPSGSGKTTLMATISHRTKGNFEGELLLNGRQVSEEVMIKISGFVPQHDITFEQLTALEHLYLMANLKMDRRTTKTSRRARVDYTVSMLGMGEFLDTRLSVLSGGERKKVTLAVQLLNDPPILFCDEVTTGLDSYSATHIVNTLKCIARTGKIVICTIHQPASGVFDMFDEVVLLSNGRLAYQGPVPMINQLFQKFDYKCPDLFNKADFVICIMNSDTEQTKRNVDEMCKLSSTDKQTDLNYYLFNDQELLDYTQHLQINNFYVINQDKLKSKIIIFNETMRTLSMSLQTKTIMDYPVNIDFKQIYHMPSKKLQSKATGIGNYNGIILSTPYLDLKFDTKAVQNWQGFWFGLITNSIFQYCYTSVITYQVEFPVVHREVSNKIYGLSVYYISQIVITFIWTVLETLVYTYVVFLIVGINWEILLVTTFVLNMLICRSYGSVLSAFFEKFENILLFSLVYDYLAVAFCGAYISLGTLPFIFYYLKYFSIFFLGCETLSILQWRDISFIPCLDVSNCLHNGKEVLLSYGYDIDRFNTDLIILGTFYVVSYTLGYYGLLRRTKKQPAY